MATVELMGFRGKKTVALYRCGMDRRLLTDKSIKEGQCAGHQVMEFVELSLKEKLQLMLGLVS